MLTVPDVGVGYGEWGRPIAAFEAYRSYIKYSPEAQLAIEAGSTTDFATYLDPTTQKTFFEAFDVVPSAWRQWADVMSVSDFKAITSVGLRGFPRLIEVPEGGEYYDAPLGEIVGPTIRVKKYGRRFSLTMETIVNDDLNRMNDIPALMGESAAETLGLHVVNALENPGLAYDGIAFFHSSHNNLISDALSEASVQTMVTKYRTQTDEEGRRINLGQPGQFVIPTDLEMTMLRIRNSSEIATTGSGATAAYGIGNANVAAQFADYVVEPLLTDTNNYYYVARPNRRRPAFKVAFLNGREVPTVMLKRPEMTVLTPGGVADPYNLEFDEIWWKVRFVYAAAPWEFRAAVKANVA